MARIEDKAIDWSLTTWEGAEREQLRRWTQLTLEEIVRAQEEMQNRADRLGGPKEPTKGEMKTVTLSVANRQAVKQRAIDAFSGKRCGAHIACVATV